MEKHLENVHKWPIFAFNYMNITLFGSSTVHSVNFLRVLENVAAIFKRSVQITEDRLVPAGKALIVPPPESLNSFLPPPHQLYDFTSSLVTALVS